MSSGERGSSRWPRLPVVVAVVHLVMLIGAAAGFIVLPGRVVGETWAQLGVATVFIGLGALLSVRVPGNRIGWVMVATGSAWGLVSLGVLAKGGVPAVLGGLVASWVWLVGLGLPATLGLLWFPTGRVPGPGWLWVQRAVVGGFTVFVIAGLLLPFEETVASAAVTNPLAVAGSVNVILPLYLGSATLIAVLALVSAASLVVRFRRAGPTERAQIGWLTWSGSIAVVAYLSGGLLTRLPGISWLMISYGGLVLIAAAIAVAVLRYRLYDIDRIVSRTVTYGALTVVLAGVYAGLVLGAQWLVGPEDASDLVVAAATLVVAALFRPLRTRLRSVIDRRFNRARYDADQVVAAFGVRLRDEVDLGALRRDIEGVVASTLAPASAGLWLVAAGEETR